MEYRISEKMQALKPSAIREIFKALTDPTIISLAAGNPSPESFPVEDLARISSEIFSDSSTAALQYSVTEGYPPLREDVKARLASRFGIGRDFDMTIITSGGQQGIELLCKTMCDEGDTVIVEEPSFIGALNAFRSNGAKLVGIPMEDDGIDIGKLEDAMKNNPRAKILYLIPTFQNPSVNLYVARKAQKSLRFGKEIQHNNPRGQPLRRAALRGRGDPDDKILRRGRICRLLGFLFESSVRRNAHRLHLRSGGDCPENGRRKAGRRCTY